MHNQAEQARLLCQRLNSQVLTPQEINQLLSELAQTEIDPSVTVLTPLTIDCGINLHFGKNIFVNAGVKIDTGAVIAAGAVVTRDVPPRTVVAGVPAKPIRSI